MLVQARALLSALILGALLLASGPVAADASPSVPTAPTARAAKSTAALGTYTPVTGATFNDPTSGKWARGRIINHIVKTIDSSPAKSTIRMAVFSFAHPEVSDALAAAYQRGVRLKLVFAGENIYSPMLRLQHLVGSDPNAKSFAIICSEQLPGGQGPDARQVLLVPPGRHGRVHHDGRLGQPDPLQRRHAVERHLHVGG